MGFLEELGKGYAEANKYCGYADTDIHFRDTIGKFISLFIGDKKG